VDPKFYTLDEPGIGRSPATQCLDDAPDIGLGHGPLFSVQYPVDRTVAEYRDQNRQARVYGTVSQVGLP
jgi:hypothetical protein